MAAEVLAARGLGVTLQDHRPAPARKFLLAGRGGLNLTHSEPLAKFLARYGAAAEFLQPMVDAFSPDDVKAWCEGLGVETFVGSSGRVFPKVMKASPLLRAWLARLAQLGVDYRPGVAWQGFDGQPTILALGGASWPEMGSDGTWVSTFEKAGIAVTALSPSNCRILFPWTDHVVKLAGSPLKNITLTYGNTVARGEIIISRDGLEGGAIYNLSRAMREQPGLDVIVDLKPELTADDVAAKLAAPRGKMSRSNFLRKVFGLSPAGISLLYEAKALSPKEVHLRPQGFAGLARAISTAGGVGLHELDAACQLKKQPLTYCVGEMIDFDAPTGGYLLQACFSTAVAAAKDLAGRLA